MNITPNELQDALAHAIATHQDRVVIDMPIAEFVAAIVASVETQRNTIARAKLDGRE